MKTIKEIEAYAKEYDVPIMEAHGIDFMCDFIKEHQIKSILEIGAAIGYSAIRMAQIDKEIHVTTIERDEERYHEAVKNIQDMGMEKQITLLFADALEANIEGCFDMIFIDAAKAQYIKFFERYENHLKQGGYILSDNLKFHGYVEHPELIRSRQLRQLVKKIGKYIVYLKERSDFTTEFLDLGDGIAISQKK